MANLLILILLNLFHRLRDLDPSNSTHYRKIICIEDCIQIIIFQVVKSDDPHTNIALIEITQAMRSEGYMKQWEHLYREVYEYILNNPDLNIFGV